MFIKLSQVFDMVYWSKSVKVSKQSLERGHDEINTSHNAHLDITSQFHHNDSCDVGCPDVKLGLANKMSRVLIFAENFGQGIVL